MSAVNDNAVAAVDNIFAGFPGGLCVSNHSMILFIKVISFPLRGVSQPGARFVFLSH
jgi:hypothetical protein